MAYRNLETKLILRKRARREWTFFKIPKGFKISEKMFLYAVKPQLKFIGHYLLSIKGFKIKEF